MTISEVALPQSNGQNFFVRPSLSGTEFVVEFVFNDRIKPDGSDGSWTVNIYDAGREPIATGLNAVPDWSLLSRCSDPRKPVGRLYLVDITGRGIPPGRNDLGARVRLTYDDLDLATVA
jgi:hypothetical protein